MDDRSRSRLALAASLLLLAIAVPSEAGMQHRMSAETLAPLAAPLKAGAKLKIARVPLIDGEEATLELERFQVWADDAEIKVFGAGQEVVERVSPPAVQCVATAAAPRPATMPDRSRSTAASPRPRTSPCGGQAILPVPRSVAAR